MIMVEMTVVKSFRRKTFLPTSRLGNIFQKKTFMNVAPPMSPRCDTTVTVCVPECKIFSMEPLIRFAGFSD